MATVRKVVISSVVVLCMVMFSPYAEAAITCSQVASGLGPCVSYVQKKESAPSPSCCAGIKGLNSAAKTSADRQATCNCLKSLSGSIKNVDMSKAAGLPGRCGVSVPYPISIKTDCSKIGMDPKYLDRTRL